MSGLRRNILHTQVCLYILAHYIHVENTCKVLVMCRAFPDSDLVIGHEERAAHATQSRDGRLYLSATNTTTIAVLLLSHTRCIALCIDVITYHRMITGMTAITLCDDARGY